METLQQLIASFTHAWQQTNSGELISFAILFAAMWLIAMLIETALKKATKEN